MKVLYLANGLPHYFNLVLSKLDASPDMEVVVVAPRTPGRNIGAGVFQSREGIGFRLVELEEYSLGLFSSFRGLTRLLLQERPDVIVFPEYMLLGFFLHPGLVYARRRTAARLVQKSIPFRVPKYEDAKRRLRDALPPPGSSAGAILQAIGLRGPLLRAILGLRARCYRRLDALVNYIDEGRDIYESYGVRRDRIWVTRNSPDTESMSRTEARVLAEHPAPKRGEQTLLHVGRLVPEKRAGLLLEAMPAILAQRPGAELHIVGDGPEKERLEALARQLGVAPAIRFVGAVYDPAELARHFLGASIFVLPGLGGLSINEAMFYRLPIVCSCGDGTERFLVREGWNGTFFQDGSHESLAKAILRLFSDPQGLRAMGNRSREIIDREVNIGTVVHEYRKAFSYACVQS